MASTTEIVFIEIYLFFLFVVMHANSSWRRTFRVIAQSCPPQGTSGHRGPPQLFLLNYSCSIVLGRINNRFV